MESEPLIGAEPADEYDGPLLAFADFMNVLGDHAGQESSPVFGGDALRIQVMGLVFDMPMELRLRAGGDERLDLRAGPPTQVVETTVFPVLHRLRVRLAWAEVADVAGGVAHGPRALD